MPDEVFTTRDVQGLASDTLDFIERGLSRGRLPRTFHYELRQRVSQLVDWRDRLPSDGSYPRDVSDGLDVLCDAIGQTATVRRQHRELLSTMLAPDLEVVASLPSIEGYLLDDPAADDVRKALQLIAGVAGEGKPNADTLPDCEPTIDAEALTVLCDLRDNAPSLRKQVEIETSTQISKKTVGKRIQWLERNGYAKRPTGQNKGATVTTTGKALADRLCPKTTR